MEKIYCDVLVVTLWKYDLEELQKEPTDKRYYIDKAGFAYEIDGIKDSGFSDSDVKDLVFFEFDYIPYPLSDEIRGLFDYFFEGLSFKEIVDKGKINKRTQEKLPESTPVIIEWFQEATHDYYNGEYDSNVGAMSLNVLDIPLYLSTIAKVEDEKDKPIGYEAGDVCNRNGCDGIIFEHIKDCSCSCHINPPCSCCTTARGYCETCGWDAYEE